MEDFICFLEGDKSDREYIKVAGPSRFAGTDSEVYLADGKIYKRFLSASETPVPVSRNTLEAYHRIQSIIAREYGEFWIPLRDIRVTVHVLPLSETDILEARGYLVSQGAFVPGKTLNEESIVFEGRYGSLGKSVLEKVHAWLSFRGLILNSDQSYIHPTNIKVSPDDYTRLTITDLGAKIPGFVDYNRHLIKEIIY